MESREKKRKTGGETQKRGENEREGVEKRGKGLSSGTRRWARDVWQAGEQRGLLSCRRGGRKRACAFDPPCGPHHAGEEAANARARLTRRAGPITAPPPPPPPFFFGDRRQKSWPRAAPGRRGGARKRGSNAHARLPAGA